jgi:hypothetical protein
LSFHRHQALQQDLQLLFLPCESCILVFIFNNDKGNFLNLIEEDFEGLICLVQNIKSKKIEKAQLKKLNKD